MAKIKRGPSDLIDVLGHRSLLIHFNKPFGKLPDWFQKAQTLGARVEILDGKLIWHDGRWFNGTWDGGQWKDGIWEQGIWKNGTFRYGVWLDGVWCNGVWECGDWYRGLWVKGTCKPSKKHKGRMCLGFNEMGKPILA